MQLALARKHLSIEEVNDSDLPENIVSLPLGKGEKQAIYLGLKHTADWTLLDDLLARQSAQQLGLKTKGTLGVIIEAHRNKLLDLEEVEVIFQAIEERDDIWISATLVKQVLQKLRNS